MSHCIDTVVEIHTGANIPGCQPDAIAEALGTMFGAVFQYATEQGIPFAGRPTARYADFGPMD